MKLFDWFIRRTTKMTDRDIRWFHRGYHSGWDACVAEHEKTLKLHGITVIKCNDKELARKLDLDRVAS